MEDLQSPEVVQGGQLVGGTKNYQFSCDNNHNHAVDVATDI